MRGGKVYLRQTGNSAALDRRLLAEVATWLGFIAIVFARAAVLRLLRRQGPAIWFTPQRPHPRYMVRAAALWAGIPAARTAGQGAIAFYLEDATVAVPPASLLDQHFNFGCGDISKSRVATVFEQVFGYPLAVDPRCWTGQAVEKSETNGTHDGRIIDCPCEPRAGQVYERLVDTIGADGLATDLRTHCIGGVPVVVWIKRRAARDRFLPPNISATTHAPADVFSPAELILIGKFVTAMGADWCGLDILRDSADGRIYIVDVNKTDAGPIVALSWRDKLASTAILARALRNMVDAPQPGGSIVSEVSVAASPRSMASSSIDRASSSCPVSTRSCSSSSEVNGLPAPSVSDGALGSDMSEAP